jgi:protein kinase C substrate 80K-H
MRYANGVRCWGGPDRSAKIELICDTVNRLSDPQEPNKCEYSLKFYTPAACDEKHLESLQFNLDSNAYSQDIY